MEICKVIRVVSGFSDTRPSRGLGILCARHSPRASADKEQLISWFGDDATYFFLTVNRQFRGWVLAVLLDEARALHEHAAGTAGRIEHASMIRFKKLHDQADDA